MGVGALVHGTGPGPHGHHGVVEPDDVALAATKTTIPTRMVGSGAVAATTVVVVVVVVVAAGDGVDGLRPSARRRL